MAPFPGPPLSVPKMLILHAENTKITSVDSPLFESNFRVDISKLQAQYLFICREQILQSMRKTMNE